MAGLQMTGLASGMDTNAIIRQLMQMERLPRHRIERQQAAAQARQDALRDIVGKLKSLKLATADLKSVTTWAPQQTVTSSDPARVGAAVTGTAGAGTYDVEVSQLATRETQTWTTRTRPTAQDLSITQGGVTKTVSIAANSTTDDVVAAINADATLGVTARNYNGELLIEAKQTGTGQSFTVSGQMLDAQTSTKAGVNTLFTVNGSAYSTTGTTSADAIPGIELSLNGVTAAGTPVRVTVSAPEASHDEVVKKAKAFVEAYNAVVDATRSRLTEKRVPNAATVTDARKGVLFGDFGLSNALSSLRMATMTPLAVGNDATLDELAELGISTGAASATIVNDSVNGKLTLDETKLRKALTDDAAGVERLLKGAADRLESVVTPMTETGGVFDGRITAAGSELSRLKDSLSRMDLRLERKEEYLRRQFTALEQALARSQMQQVDLASRLPGLKND